MGRAFPGQLFMAGCQFDMLYGHTNKTSRPSGGEGQNVKNGEAFSHDDLVLFLENAPANLFFKDTNCRYQLVSEVCQLVNGGPDHSLIGKTDLEIWDDESVGRAYYEDDLRIIETGEGSECVNEFPGPDGPLFFSIKKRPVHRDGKLVGIVGIVADITVQMRLARELERQSITDQLTGLYNRNYLEINSDVVHDDDDYPISLLMLDCNYLKQTNDCLGHAAGDRLLKRVAQVIKENMPSERAIAARLGGDEFCIACGRMDEKGIRELAHAVKRGCAQASDDELTIDVSMGYATIQDASVGSEIMFRMADQAMYEDKKRAHAERER